MAGNKRAPKLGTYTGKVWMADDFELSEEELDLFEGPLVWSLEEDYELSAAATVVNMHAAKTHLSELVARAKAGEEIVIAKGGEPQVRLVAVEPTRRNPVFGTMAGRMWVADDFDAPMSEEELALWEGPLVSSLEDDEAPA